jgi:hypothetical protein
MESLRSDLVQIVRDFLVAHQTMRGVFARFREGTLTFGEVQALVGDSESSVLFRVKERCHALFRESGLHAPSNMRREALFDLAVGSLFHEAMKFRENFYQREIYAPRFESLRGDVGDEADALIGKFDEIMEGAASRLNLVLQENEALLDHTSVQLRVLLVGHRENGLIARCLIEHRDQVDAVFVGGLQGILKDIYGEVAEGYVAAAHSYLESALFSLALAALEDARKHDGYDNRDDLLALSIYARGMQTFLDGQYAQGLDLLEEWVELGIGELSVNYGGLARSAVSRVGKLVEPPDAEKLGARGVKLARRIDRASAGAGGLD